MIEYIWYTFTVLVGAAFLAYPPAWLGYYLIRLFWLKSFQNTPLGKEFPLDKYVFPLVYDDYHTVARDLKFPAVFLLYVSGFFLLFFVLVYGEAKCLDRDFVEGVSFVGFLFNSFVEVASATVPLSGYVITVVVLVLLPKIINRTAVKLYYLKDKLDSISTQK